MDVVGLRNATAFWIRCTMGPRDPRNKSEGRQPEDDALGWG
jgi:hypothetical protein